MATGCLQNEPLLVEITLAVCDGSGFWRTRGIVLGNSEVKAHASLPGVGGPMRE